MISRRLFNEGTLVQLVGLRIVCWIQEKQPETSQRCQQLRTFADNNNYSMSVEKRSGFISLGVCISVGSIYNITLLTGEWRIVLLQRSANAWLQHWGQQAYSDESNIISISSGQEYIELHVISKWNHHEMVWKMSFKKGEGRREKEVAQNKEATRLHHQILHASSITQKGQHTLHEIF